MPVADNQGGNLNLLVFEVGMIRRIAPGVEIIKTVAIHPLLVAPASIRYSDTSRSNVTDNHAGTIITKAGRRPRTFQYQGTFGVETRGLLLYIGTGDLRFRKFYHEVVRLGEAVTKDHVDDAKDPFRSPLLALGLLGYNEQDTTFYVNYWDFWHQLSFEATIGEFSWSKAARGGGASGLTQYNLTGREVGPLVVGGLGTALIDRLFQALTAWDSINELIKSYTLDAILGSFAAAGDIILAQMIDSINAVNAQIDGVTAVMNGFATNGGEPVTSKTTALQSATRTARALETATEDHGTTGLAGFLGNAERMKEAALEADSLLQSNLGSQPADDGYGVLPWDTMADEGAVKMLDALDAAQRLADLASAGAWQAAAGSLYGMSRAEFAEFLAGQGDAGVAPGLTIGVRHVVRPWDTAEAIVRLYHTSWDEILRANRMLPDEALVTGRALLVPSSREFVRPQAVANLPTFGSHTGQAAWGTDLFTDLRVDASGRLAVASGEDVLIQGVNWIVEISGADMIEQVNQLPDDVRPLFVESKLRAILATDRRISSVDRVEVATDQASASMTVEVSATAINGGTFTARAA